MYDRQSTTESRARATTPVRVGAGLGAVLVLLAAGAVAHHDGPAPRPSAAPSPVTHPDPLVAPAKGAGTTARPSPSLTETAVLRDLVGRPLDEARKAAAAAGFSRVTSHDATGRERVQIAEHNWTVCAQTPLPGTHPTFTEVDFATAERTEPCPG